jgi:hypothetical protein
MAELPIGYPQAQPAQRTGMATASLTLGIISIPTTCACVGPVLGIVAIILGGVAVGRTRRAPQLYGGKGRAVGGIVTGSLALVLSVVAALLWGMFVLSFLKSNTFATLIDIGQVEEALRAYERIHHDYPPDLTSLSASGLLQPNTWGSARPAADPARGCSYVRDVHPTDPPHWILAYPPVTLGPLNMVSVFYADKHSTFLEAREFANKLAAFKEEYQAARGTPAKVLEPAKEP